MKVIMKSAAAAALMSVALSASAFSTGHISPHEFETEHSTYSDHSRSSSYRNRYDEPAYARDTSGYDQGRNDDSEEQERKRRDDRYEDFEPPTHVRIR